MVAASSHNVSFAQSPCSEESLSPGGFLSPARLAQDPGPAALSGWRTGWGDPSCPLALSRLPCGPSGQHPPSCVASSPRRPGGPGRGHSAVRVVPADEGLPSPRPPFHPLQRWDRASLFSLDTGTLRGPARSGSAGHALSIHRQSSPRSVFTLKSQNGHLLIL